MVTIGASELAVALGYQRRHDDGEPYTSALEVWQRLTGRVERYEEDPTNLDAEVGRWSEVAVAGRYMAGHGLSPLSIRPGPNLHEPGLRAPVIPWLHVRPDLLEHGEPVELKSPRELDPERWGPSGTDQLPNEYLIQLLAQLAVCNRLYGAERARLAALARAPRSGQRVYAEFQIQRDPDLEGAILRQGYSWYQQHVMGDVQPDPDGSHSAGRALARMWTPERDTEVWATPEQCEIAQKIVQIGSAAREQAHRATELKQQLQAQMGEATVLKDRGGRTIATWRVGRDGQRRFWLRRTTG